MTLEPAISGASVCRNLLQGESKLEVNKENKITTNCQVDAETKQNFLKHLEEHGAVSLLTSAKFGQYTGCFLEEIERAIAAESALIASAAGDSTGNPDAPASPADEATESPADRCIYFRSPTSSLWDPPKLTGTASWRMGSSKGYNSRLEPFN